MLLLSTNGQHGNVVVELAVQLGALGGAAVKECDAPVATGVMPSGG